MRVLVTRPQPDAMRTAERLLQLRHEVLIEPLLVMEPAKVTLPSLTFDAVAVTSANAMRAAKELEGLDELLHVSAFAVGARTAEAVKASGFGKVTYSDGDAAELADLLRRSLPRGARLLHLSGEHRAKEFSALLAPAGIEVTTLPLYRMKAAASLSSEAQTAISSGSVQSVLHYSTRTAAVFVTLMKRAEMAGHLGKLRHLCLSRAVGEPILAAGGKPEIATLPNEESLLSLL